MRSRKLHNSGRETDAEPDRQNGEHGEQADDDRLLGRQI
jgi:hypothetical protein